MSDKQIKDITGGSKLGLEDFYSQMKTSGAFEPPKKKKTGGVENGVNPNKVAKEERRLKRIRGKGVARADSKKPFTGKYDTSPYNKPLEEKKVGGMTKKMNMGGVMKNRGGTFKGTF